MMPVESCQIPGGARVLLEYCEVCNQPACIGLDAHVSDALRRRDKRLAGRWYCGVTADGRAMCRETGEIFE